MSIFSSILNRAFTVIPHSSVGYQKFISKAISDFGVATLTYTDEERIKAIVEPGIVSSFGGKCIELKDYKEMGLDWSRRYITVWMPAVGLEPCADREGADRIIHNNKVFTVLQVENWEDYNGWQRVYCVEDKSEEA